jgi:hypothetical protein
LISSVQQQLTGVCTTATGRARNRATTADRAGALLRLSKFIAPTPDASSSHPLLCFVCSRSVELLLPAISDLPCLQTLRLGYIWDMSALTQLPASCVDLTVNVGRGMMRPSVARHALADSMDLGHLVNCTRLTCGLGCVWSASVQAPRAEMCVV